MDYSKFYTPPKIAALLVQQLNATSPHIIIDICCGSCNLLHAANNRWKKAKMVGVDIAQHSSTNVHCVQMDGRKYAFEHDQKYPLVLANPPFDFVSQKKEFPDLYTGLPSDFSTSRLEIEMLLANIRLLNDGGVLMIIMPSTFVNAASNIKLRKYLGQNYHIQKIIRLPDDTFGAAKINSYALVIKNDLSKKRLTRLYSVVLDNGKYSISEPIFLSQNQIKTGRWEKESAHNINNTHLSIRRGNISSQSFCASGTPILHTAKACLQWEPSTRYVAEVKAKSVYAETGDIIVSRIGKSAGQWCRYSGEKILISDCLYCIKDPQGTITEKLHGQQYSLPLKGVATRYITIKDFTIWYNSL